jgi:hypothetical protein
MFSPADGSVRIYLVDGLRPAKLVADTFTAFVNSIVTDSANIYPDDAG